MTALAHVFAVEVEPGWYASEHMTMPTETHPWIFDDLYGAECERDYQRESRGYPSARVVRFQLVEVKELA